jgi:hypothetical protein
VDVLTFAIRFNGRVSSVRPGVFETAARAPAEAVLEAHAGAAGFVRGHFDGATLLAELTLTGTDRYEEQGTVTFASGDALHFRSLLPGQLQTGAEGARRGGGVSRIESGAGRLATARGHLSSSFVVMACGELVDGRVAVFVIHPTPADPSRPTRRQA